MAILTAPTTKFVDYSQFKNLKDFNNQIEMWMTQIKNKFTPTELIAIKRLIRFSAKIPGVCNAGMKKIVAATKAKDVQNHGVSLSSLRRAIKKATSLGLLLIKNTIRKDNSQSTNLYIFNAFNCQTNEQGYKKQETPQTAPVKENIVEQLNTLKTNNISKANNIININTYNTGINKNDMQDHQEIKDIPIECKLSFNQMSLYQKMQHLLKSTVGHDNDLKEFSKVVYGNINRFLKFGYSDQRNHVEDIAYQSLKRIIHLKEYAKNPFGLLHYNLNLELDKLAQQLIFEERQAMDNMLDISDGPEWLYWE